jgi:hypothetical protein
MSRGAEVEVEVLSDSNSRASSSESESRLPERLGTSGVEYRPSELLDAIEIAGVVALASEIGSQQKVSLFHNLQLRFSNLLPSSREPAHLENTMDMSVFTDLIDQSRRTMLTSPHAEQILDIASIDFMY